ncbi:MAG: nitrilase-related carbon-nitrogen hydrolase [Planctomycetota bacterium]|jgi:predicted amidohydrolase
MRIGFYQFRPLFGKPDHNCRKVIDRLSQVRADLIVLPELAFTGYLFKDRAEVKALAEDPRRSGLVQSLVALCRRRGFHLVAGFAEKARDKYFNSALLLGPRGIRRVYRKLHFFMDENSWFDPGDKELGIDRVRGARIGMMICFDWVFPEVARTLALAGADVICHPSDLVLGHCQQAMLTRSLENGVFSVTANRFGTDRRPHGEVRFTGRSQIVGPRGELLFRAPAQRDVLHVMKIDPARARDKAITPKNQLLKHRRPDFYA